MRLSLRRGYALEPVVLALVAITALSFFSYIGPQDVSRLALTHALVFDRSVRIDRWESGTIDKAFRDGHFYTDKAPGMSFVAVPPLMAMTAVGSIDHETRENGVWRKRSLVWILRLLTGGIAFVVAVFLVGRAAESLIQGTGAATASAFGLGTLVLPLAATLFGHVAAATLGFASFVLVASGLQTRHSYRWVVFAGLCGGLALLVEYQAALVAVVVFGYLALLSVRHALAFAAALASGLVALGAYNIAAFGSPLRMSYGYVAEERFVEHQREGLFGIGIPAFDALRDVLVSEDGLVMQSPVLVLAAVGLGLLWHRGNRAEAAVCGLVPLLFLLVTAGYYDPFGGLSPGPRFFVPALPFLAVGLACAFARWRILTLTATLVSVSATLYEAGTWAVPDDQAFTTFASLLGAPRQLGILTLCATALAAVLVANAAVLFRRSRVEQCR